MVYIRLPVVPEASKALRQYLTTYILQQSTGSDSQQSDERRKSSQENKCSPAAGRPGFYSFGKEFQADEATILFAPDPHGYRVWHSEAMGMDLREINMGQ